MTSSNKLPVDKVAPAIMVVSIQKHKNLPACVHIISYHLLFKREKKQCSKCPNYVFCLIPLSFSCAVLYLYPNHCTKKKQFAPKNLFIFFTFFSSFSQSLFFLNVVVIANYSIHKYIFIIKSIFFYIYLHFILTSYINYIFDPPLSFF